MAGPVPIRLDIAADSQVGALIDAPDAPWAALALAHGAGAGMDHAFMAATARGLAERGIAVLRFQFPYMERGSRRPDTPAVAQAAVRVAVAASKARWPGLPLFAGGKSFGGRMSSQAQAVQPLDGVIGLVFLGFPLHPAGKPGIERADHLDDVAVPMLFVQGTRDELAQPELLVPLVTRLATRAKLHAIDEADHSFHVPARSGRKDAQVLVEALDVVAEWMRGLS